MMKRPYQRPSPCMTDATKGQPLTASCWLHPGTVSMHELLSCCAAGKSTAVSFASGALAGAAATVASYPFDLLRTTLAAQGEPKVIGTEA